MELLAIHTREKTIERVAAEWLEYEYESSTRSSASRTTRRKKPREGCRSFCCQRMGSFLTTNGASVLGVGIFGGA